MILSYLNIAPFIPSYAFLAYTPSQTLSPDCPVSTVRISIRADYFAYILRHDHGVLRGDGEERGGSDQKK
jgi:hypothetical protein